jgi:long-chain acyl-CoA synthetase
MHIDFLLNVFNEYMSTDAIIWRDTNYSYKYLTKNIEKLTEFIESQQLERGAIVAVIGDFSPNSIALLLTLIQKEFIIVPLTKSSNVNEHKLFAIAKVEFAFRISDEDKVSGEYVSERVDHEYYTKIRRRDHPGLVLFTSGSSGEPKAAVHDFLALLEKFRTRRGSLKTLNFLLFDHWGGLNTMFHILSNGGTVITTTNRNPENVCKLIELHKIELLPASPTFLNLMLISGVHEDYDNSSLKIISYGTEPMPESTLMRLKSTFPDVKLLQTYGLIELGVMRSKSENNDSLWVKVGGEGYSTRVADGMLEIKADSAMIGYLNSPSPFTLDGWFKTGDAVEVKGEYVKILGRKSEIINVGGEKVYPQEVENVILQMNDVAEVTVFGEKNPIMGNIVCAEVRLKNCDENKKIFISNLKTHCRANLSGYKVPVKIKIVKNVAHSERFKKARI